MQASIAHENTSYQVVVDSSFASDWLKGEDIFS